MVKFQIVSDLHIEIEDKVPDIKSLITPSAPVLILAGDIGRIHKYEQLKEFLTEVCKHFEYVLYVLGNHEYYRVKDIPIKSMDELLQDLTTINLSIKNLYVLNRSSVIIDNVCIAGCTLWSYATAEIPSFIVRIKNMNRERYNRMHIQDLQYIRDMIKYCNVHNHKLLVVSHHCPSYFLLKDSKKHAKDRYKSLYATNLEYLLNSEQIHTWVFGHSHHNKDYRTKGGTRIVSNQKGKPRDNVTDFLSDKVITV